MWLISEIMLYIKPISDWCNINSGYLSLLLFIFTIAFGWLSGIFSSLRKKPMLTIEVLNGPSFCSSFNTGRIHLDHEAHRTAFSLYLSITNIGHAPTDIDKIHIGYKSFCYKNPFRWFWLKDLTACKSDFIVNLGNDKSKVYPFLMQINQNSKNTIDTYLLQGKKCNGIVYYEQSESWGTYLPRHKKNQVDIIIKVFDVYGNFYTKKAKIPKLTIEAARQLCEHFGETKESVGC